MTASAVVARSSPVLDRFERPLRDLRISVTDRCNFRCPYCMPKSVFGPGHRFQPNAEVLRADEILRLASVFVSLGVTKIRLTGGEPLLRSDLAEIVSGLASLRISDLALTTNGALLRRWAFRLRDAGLHRVTVSLDSLNPVVFATMSDSHVDVSDVLDGLAAAREAGLQPVKVNCVVRRGFNEAGVLDLVAFARAHELTLRFIEYMDVGATNGWRREDVVDGDDLRAVIDRIHPLIEVAAEPGAVARRYRYADGRGEIGLITSVSRPFCGDCVRARLGVDGRLFTCLFATDGVDLRTPLRRGAGDDELRVIVQSRWQGRDDRYSELRPLTSASAPRVEMSYIGG